MQNKCLEFFFFLQPQIVMHSPPSTCNFVRVRLCLINAFALLLTTLCHSLQVRKGVVLLLLFGSALGRRRDRTAGHPRRTRLSSGRRHRAADSRHQVWGVPDVKESRQVLRVCTCRRYSRCTRVFHINRYRRRGGTGLKLSSRLRGSRYRNEMRSAFSSYP